MAEDDPSEQKPDGTPVSSLEELVSWCVRDPATGTYRCNICDIPVKRRNNLKRHVRTHLPNQVRCSICNRYFQSEAEKAEHQSLKHPHPLLCYVCGTSFQRNYDLEQHLCKHGIKSGTDTLTFRCDFPGCNKVFHRKALLTYHMNAHSGVRPYHCQVCDRDFHNEYARNNHQKTCRIVALEFACDSCTASFRTEHLLHEHTRLAHTDGELRLRCHCGDLVFTSRSELIRHMTDAHKPLPTEGNVKQEPGFETTQHVADSNVFENPSVGTDQETFFACKAEQPPTVDVQSEESTENTSSTKPELNVPSTQTLHGITSNNAVRLIIVQQAPSTAASMQQELANPSQPNFQRSKQYFIMTSDGKVIGNVNGVSTTENHTEAESPCYSEPIFKKSADALIDDELVQTVGDMPATIMSTSQSEPQPSVPEPHYEPRHVIEYQSGIEDFTQNCGIQTVAPQSSFEGQPTSINAVQPLPRCEVQEVPQYDISALRQGHTSTSPAPYVSAYEEHAGSIDDVDTATHDNDVTDDITAITL